MVLAEAVIFLIVVAILLRRDLGALAQLRFRGGWKLTLLVAGLFAVQALVILYAPGQSAFQVVTLMLSQGALLVLMVLNYHVPGAALFSLGIALNLAVMLANGGWMPITPEMYRFVHPERAVEVQSRAPDSKGIILPREQTNLWVLSDIVPIALPWRRTAVSIGDLLLIGGAAQFIFQGSVRRQVAKASPMVAQTGCPHLSASTSGQRGETLESDAGRLTIRKG
ncbi:MAG: DUF5317 family protein [Anaerolineae bacterium]|nr:DUF5317 domain-containing protein [Anaerolineae bacterium]MDW8101210.1 DUF5317 family protein [Anaerolineae bacterium]